MHNNLPKTLYKYLSNESQYLFDSLENNYWYFAHKDDFNDPSDFQVRWTTKNQKDILKKFIEHRHIRNKKDIFELLTNGSLSDYFQLALDQNILKKPELVNIFRGEDNPFEKIETFQNKIGILCLSTSNNNSMMYSHYSNNHKGICIEYNSERIFDHFKKDDQVNIAGAFVKYEHEQPNPFFLEQAGENQTKEYNNSLKQQILCKYDFWNYEEEYRVLRLPIDNKDNSNFSRSKLTLPDKSIRSIIFGHNCSIDFKNEVMAKLNPQIEFKQARVLHDRYNHVEIFEID